MNIVYDKTLYSGSAIRKAIADYASIADIEVQESSDRFICTINRSKYPLDTTALEFSNYVLNLSVASERPL